jgi:hypothetical protein
MNATRAVAPPTTAVVDVVQPQQQFHQRRLAGARHACDADEFARTDVQVKSLENRHL